MGITRNWIHSELGSPGFRDPHVFFEAKAKKKRPARRCGLGPLSAEEEHCQAQPPCGPCFRSRRKSRGGQVVFVGSVWWIVSLCIFGDSLCSWPSRILWRKGFDKHHKQEFNSRAAQKKVCLYNPMDGAEPQQIETARSLCCVQYPSTNSTRLEGIRVDTHKNYYRVCT